MGELKILQILIVFGMCDQCCDFVRRFYKSNRYDTIWRSFEVLVWCLTLGVKKVI